MTKRQALAITTTLGVIILAVTLRALFTADTADVNAQVVTDACTKTTQATHIDLSISHVGKYLAGEGTDSAGEVKARIAGADFHYSGHVTGDPHLPYNTFEAVYLDGVGYSQVDNGPWAVTREVDQEVLARLLQLQPAADGSWDLCPQVTNIEKVGPETLDGVATTHYTSLSEQTTKMGKTDVVFNLALDYWLDEEGLLVQLQFDVIHRQGEYETLNRTTTKVSGVGEVNTITAPTLGQ